MFEGLPDIKTGLLIFYTAFFSFAVWLIMRVKIKRLQNICESLRRANNNLSKTFPDIKILLDTCNKKKETTPVEPTGLRLYRAVRVKDSPDLRLGNISEVIISANDRGSAMKLLRSIENLKDDEWWVLEDINKEQVIAVKYLGELL